MNLEDDINLTNKYILDNDIAVIHKKPTPIKVVKVDYNKRINTKITELIMKYLLLLTIMVYIKENI